MQAGDVIDGFTLVERLATGGMGSLWRATNPAFDFPLVLQLPFFDPGQDVSTIIGYEIEEMILKRLTGPHVPRFAGSGDLAIMPYIAMEFVAGDSLEKRMQGDRLLPAEIARTGALIATALASIHRQNVVHLDVKPANILLAERGAVLLDFGLSRHFELPDLLGEESSMPMGTAAYLAPEQVLGNRSLTASDIFALGCILYEMAAGGPPFGVPSTTAGMKRRIYHAPRRLRDANPAVPQWLDTIVHKCLEVDPARRYANAGNVAFDLTHPEQVVIAKPDAPAEQSGNWFSRFFKSEKAPDLTGQRRRHGRAVILAAVDLSNGVDALAEEVRAEASRALATSPGARLALLTVLKTELLGQGEAAAADGRSAYVTLLVALRDWARPLNLPDDVVSYHVVEAVSAANAILNYASHNDVGQIIIGARGSSALRRHLGSVSAEVVAEALCSVSVVRVKQVEERTAGFSG
jgi:eukaryotic-like serine/threonine-protein kinase